MKNNIHRNEELREFKRQVFANSDTFGFWTVFRATMGFYAAQLLATIMGLATFALIGGIIIAIVVYFTK